MHDTVTLLQGMYSVRMPQGKCFINCSLCCIFHSMHIFFASMSYIQDTGWFASVVCILYVSTFCFTDIHQRCFYTGMNNNVTCCTIRPLTLIKLHLLLRVLKMLSKLYVLKNSQFWVFFFFCIYGYATEDFLWLIHVSYELLIVFF